MYSVTSLGKFQHHRGTIYLIESPVAATREWTAYLEALGGRILIDGMEFEPRGVEWHVPATPVYVGEKIGLLVNET